ncbi:MAG: flagellar hook-length control protein FliK [Burkholderiales bacterium]|nr:flagellar hook-length control protein FliK [Burkholderiales bacterium]
MDANQFFSIANQASPTLDALVQGTLSLAVPSGKTDFANLFNGQMLAQMRQEFAAPVPVQVDLQLVSLGPKINLITADAPLPDMESLASFARAQGLDEEAVRTLFGSPPTSINPKLTDLLDQSPAQFLSEKPAQRSPDMPDPLASVLALMPGRVAATLTALNQPPELPLSSIPVSSSTPVDLLNQSQVVAVSDTTAPLTCAIASVPSPIVATTVTPHPIQVSALATRPGSIAVNESPLPNLMSLGTAATAELPQTPADSIKTADPLIAYLASVQMSARQQTALPVTNAPVTDMPSHAVADPMQIAMRVRLDVQSQEITRRLSLMSGSSQKASWAAIAGSGITDTGLTKPLETLHIDIPSVPLSGLSDGPVSLTSDLVAGLTPLYGGSGETAKTLPSDAATASNAEPTSESVLLAQRSAQYQQLADRVGQSLGERLLSQIEKGEWSLKLRLQPESLGRVDVALAMHGGALDASFASDNSMTRELILQGAGKLRDTLAQSGMAVATVWVGGDQGRKHDGNPTPGRSFKSASGAIRKSDAEPVLGVSSPGRLSTTNEGLDVLA